MSYEALMTLKETMNNSFNLVQDILNENRDDFAQNESHINIGIGILGEIRNIFSAIDTDLYILNKELYELITPIQKYSDNLFNNYKIVNAYKLYDFLSIDYQNLKVFLNKIGQ